MMLRVGCEMVKSPEALERRRLHALEYEQRKRDEQKKSKTTRAKGDPLPTSPILKGKNGGGARARAEHRLCPYGNEG